MEHLVSLLQSALGLTVKQGWTWLGAGVAVLVLNAYAIGPFAKLDVGWVAVAGIVAVFGALILIVSLGSWTVGKQRRGLRGNALQKQTNHSGTTLTQKL